MPTQFTDLYASPGVNEISSITLMNLTSNIILSCTQDPFSPAQSLPWYIRQRLVLHNITCKRREILWSILVGLIHLVICRKRVRYETKNSSLTSHISFYKSARFKGDCALQHSIVHYSTALLITAVALILIHAVVFINRTNYYPGKAIMHPWSWLKALFQPILHFIVNRFPW